MTKKFIIVYIEDCDNAQGVFDNETGKLVHTIDVYHGGSWQEISEFCKDVGIDYEVIDFESLMAKALSPADTEMLEDLNSNEIYALKEIEEKVFRRIQ